MEAVSNEAETWMVPPHPYTIPRKTTAFIGLLCELRPVRNSVKDIVHQYNRQSSQKIQEGELTSVERSKQELKKVS